MAEPIIPPVDTRIIEKEMTEGRFLRRTNKGGNEIYVFDGREAPEVMREIGRLREIAFRTAGGGTGKECDIDQYDLMDPPCRQLVVWDPQEKTYISLPPLLVRRRKRPSASIPTARPASRPRICSTSQSAS